METVNSPQKIKRLYSIDALRGFDMFWIVGGSAFFVSLAKYTDVEWLNALSLQFEHVTWDGFHFYDLIFPLFMFISGAVIPYSVISKLEKGEAKSKILVKSIKRLLLLVFLGIVYNGTLKTGFSEARYASVLGQIGVTLMGVFAGVILKRHLYSEMKRVGILLLIGTVLIIISVLLHPVYPIIKNCWTTTFTLLTGGISFILLALFYLVIDVWGWKKWSIYFRVIGMNPLFIYLFYRMVRFRDTSLFLLGWLTGDFENKASHPIVALGVVFLVYGLLYFLYKKKVFIKI